MAVRPPYVAGAFYAGRRERLKGQIDWCFRTKLGPGELPEVNPQPLAGPVGLVLPHAGYQYSGPVAAHGFGWLAGQGRPETAVIVGTNHTGRGAGVSIGADGAWKTPLGVMEVDSSVAEGILQQSALIEPDERAFAREHSVEVQLPFLQELFGNMGFVPIVCLDQRLEPSRELGGAIAAAVWGSPVALIASSDLTHYEPHQQAERKDRAAIERVLQLDVEGFYQVIGRERASICGYGPIATVMEAARILELKDGKLLKYATSGDVVGERSAVVGYASIVMGKGP